MGGVSGMPGGGLARSREFPPARTRLVLNDFRFPELERDLAAVLRRRPRNGRLDEHPDDPNALFQAALAEVIRAIQATRPFGLLKQFIAYGSLLPTWDTHSKNPAHPLSDAELVKCVNFISGHMVTKFQGEVCEILARDPLENLVLRLQMDGQLAPGGRLAFGDSIRCRAARGLWRVKGPDALYFTASKGLIRIHAIAEIKSGYVSPRNLDKQSRRHLAALRRGLWLNDAWSEPARIRVDDPVLRVYIAPSSWLLSRRFHFEPTKTGRRLIMDERPLPPIAQPGPREAAAHVWILELAWSHDALRAAAFELAHGYMAEVGEALAAVGLARPDMPPADAGMNDFRHQLHVAIFRQQDAEPNKKRREKTIDLYNVFGFGWALGHNFRNKSGEVCIMYPEDLDEMAT